MPRSPSFYILDYIWRSPTYSNPRSIIHKCRSSIGHESLFDYTMFAAQFDRTLEDVSHPTGYLHIDITPVAR